MRGKVSERIKAVISIFLLFLFVSIFFSNPSLLFPKDNKNIEGVFSPLEGAKKQVNGAAAVEPSESFVYKTVNINLFQSSASITIDGKLDEPVYKELVSITKFTQSQPDEGKPLM